MQGSSAKFGEGKKERGKKAQVMGGRVGSVVRKRPLKQRGLG